MKAPDRLLSMLQEKKPLVVLYDESEFQTIVPVVIPAMLSESGIQIVSEIRTYRTNPPLPGMVAVVEDERGRLGKTVYGGVRLGTQTQLDHRPDFFCNVDYREDWIDLRNGRKHFYRVYPSSQRIRLRKPRIFEIGEEPIKNVRQNMFASLQEETGLKDLKLFVHVNGIFDDAAYALLHDLP